MDRQQLQQLYAAIMANPTGPEARMAVAQGWVKQQEIDQFVAQRRQPPQPQPQQPPQQSIRRQQPTGPTSTDRLMASSANASANVRNAGSGLITAMKGEAMENPWGRQAEALVESGHLSEDDVRDASIRRIKSQRRPRGWVRPSGYSHFTDEQEEKYEAGIGAKIDRGAYLDNLDKVRRSAVHGNNFASSGLGTLGSNQSAESRARHRALNSEDARLAQESYFADRLTQIELTKRKRKGGEEDEDIYDSIRKMRF